MFSWLIHLGWDWTPDQQLWLDAGFAPAGPINSLTYLRPSLVCTWSFK